MDTLNYIMEKYNLKLGRHAGIEIPNMRRNDLAMLFKELGYRVGAEIGVRSGEFSEVICKANPTVKLFSIDPWRTYEGYKSYFDEDDELDQKQHDRYYKQAKDKLKLYNCELIKKFSMEAVKIFEDETLDFVYIDGSHRLKDVIDDITAWSKKVRKGGIISGHDYWKSQTHIDDCHVGFAVDAYIGAYKIYPCFLIGKKYQEKGLKRDDFRSWFWIK